MSGYRIFTLAEAEAFIMAQPDDELTRDYARKMSEAREEIVAKALEIRLGYVPEPSFLEGRATKIINKQEGREEYYLDGEMICWLGARGDYQRFADGASEMMRVTFAHWTIAFGESEPITDKEKEAN